MNVDVAVLGGGPAGYTGRHPRRAAWWQVACIEREADALGGTCLRVGCIPTKAWVQTRTPSTTRGDVREARRRASRADARLEQVAAWKARSSSR